MSENIKVILVIPVYNHGKTLREVVIKALEIGAEVMVVDDGSTDGGLETLSGLNIILIRHSQNRGKGAAILTAAKEAGQLGMTHIVTMDADGQHDPADFSRFIPVIRENPLALVIGKRIFDKKTTPFLSRFGRSFSNFWFRAQTGYSLKDTQSGFRAYPVAVLNWLKLYDKRFSFEVEVLVKAAWAGIELKEVDISVHYPVSGERVSHFHLFKDNLALSLLNTRLTIRAAVPLPHRQFLAVKDDSEKIATFHPMKSLRKNMNEGPQQRENPTQWTSRSIGSNFQHNIFYAFIRIGGQKAPYALLYGVALYYVLFRPSIRTKADDYLRRRFETKNLLKKRLNSFRIYVNFGKALIDKAVIGINGPDNMKVAFDDREAMWELVRGGRGLLILTAHVGCWQAAMSALHFLEKPVSLLLHHEEGDVDLQYFEHAGVPPPFRIIDPMGYLGGVLEMMDVLKKGEVLCIMGDRILGDEKNTVSVNFLGGRIRLPISAFKLAAATGVSIAVLFSYKSGPDSYRLFLDKVIRVPKEAGGSIKTFQPYVARFAEALESYVRQFPYQFYNFFNMWEENQEVAKNEGRINS